MGKTFKVFIVVSLVLLQAFLFSKVLMLNTAATLFVVSFYGTPFALLSAYFLLNKSHWQYLNMTMAMFAAGGLGMFIGYLVDIENLGLNGPFGLMSICRVIADQSFTLDTLWFMLKSTPWMYIGMFVGGNIGMLCLERVIKNQFFDYALSNIGMLSGMLLAHIFSITLTTNFSLFWGNVFMLVFMLSGMVLGMLVLLYLFVYIKKIFQLGYNKQQIV